MSLCDRNYAILRTNRARCTLDRKILDLLDEESISGACSGTAILLLAIHPFHSVRLTYLSVCLDDITNYKENNALTEQFF